VRVLALVLCLARAAEAQVVSAVYEQPTDRYAHGILGDSIEWGALSMRLVDGRRVRIVLPEDRVFEDTAPRVADVDVDGAAEVVVVESSVTQGSRLAVYGPAGLIAATPFIGQANRWLAPVGAADLDGDGRVEIAYVDRPHLAKTLRIWRFAGSRLTEVAAAPGYTNHRIGERDIAGGIRDCGAGPEMIVADAEWRQVVAVRFDGRLNVRPLGPHSGRESFAAAMACALP
jgi:hypothetical protein